MTFDRYLLRSFCHTFGVCFITTWGLAIVIDLLENLDQFLAHNSEIGGNTASLLNEIFKTYSYQSILFLDRAGPALTVISLMVMLVLLQRSGELHPLLAAGIPMYRILAPLVFASMGIYTVLTLNQEFIVPNIAHAAFETRGSGDMTRHEVESFTDHTSRISIDGHRIQLSNRTINEALFVLPAPSLVTEITILEAPTATYFPARGKRPSGWLLRDVKPSPGEIQLKLTESGREKVWFPSDKNAFVISSVTSDQLHQRTSSYSLLSTPELIQRIKCPAFGMVSVHRLVLHLHARLVQPFLNLITVLIVVPLMVRRESPGLVADSALCGFVLASMFAITQGSQFLGSSQFVPADLAAWLPVIIGGTVSAWLSGVIRT